MRSCTSATNLFGSVIIIAQDLSVSPLSLSRQSSHKPAIVSAGEPSRVGAVAVPFARIQSGSVTNTRHSLHS
jgi:hypothetical protein